MKYRWWWSWCYCVINSVTHKSTICTTSQLWNFFFVWIICILTHIFSTVFDFYFIFRFIWGWKLILWKKTIPVTYFWQYVFIYCSIDRFHTFFYSMYICDQRFFWFWYLPMLSISVVVVDSVKSHQRHHHIHIQNIINFVVQPPSPPWLT